MKASTMKEKTQKEEGLMKRVMEEEEEEEEECKRRRMNLGGGHKLNAHLDGLVLDLCSMCGDVGLPNDLFLCLLCCHRYQHSYCSSGYPQNKSNICDWCLLSDRKQSADESRDINCKDMMNRMVNYRINSKNVSSEDQQQSAAAAKERLITATNQNQKGDSEKIAKNIDGVSENNKDNNESQAFKSLLRVAEEAAAGERQNQIRSPTYHKNVRIKDNQMLISSINREMNLNKKGNDASNHDQSNHGQVKSNRGQVSVDESNRGSVSSRAETNRGEAGDQPEANRGQGLANRGQGLGNRGQGLANRGQVSSAASNRSQVEANRGQVSAVIRGQVEGNRGQFEGNRGQAASNRAQITSNNRIQAELNRGQIPTNRGSQIECSRGQVSAMQVEANRGQFEGDVNRGQAASNRGQIPTNRGSQIECNLGQAQLDHHHHHYSPSSIPATISNTNAWPSNTRFHKPSSSSSDLHSMTGFPRAIHRRYKLLADVLC